MSAYCNITFTTTTLVSLEWGLNSTVGMSFTKKFRLIRQVFIIILKITKIISPEYYSMKN